MIEHTQTLLVTSEEADSYTKACSEAAGAEPKDKAIFDREVTFPNGLRIAIQVVTTENPEKEPCWTQAVAFDQVGNEVGLTDVNDVFLGDYSIEIDGEKYTVIVAGPNKVS